MTNLIYVLYAGLGLTIVYEVTAAIRDSETAPTISQYVWRLSARRPILPFLLGLLMGHFFA